MMTSPNFGRTKRNTSNSCYNKLKNKIGRELSNPRSNEYQKDNMLAQKALTLSDKNNKDRKEMESKVAKIVEDFIAKNTNASNLQAYQYKSSSSTENIEESKAQPEESEENIRMIDENILKSTEDDFLEKLDEDCCNSYFQFWKKAKNRNIERSKSEVRSDDSGTGKLSLFNNTNDKSLIQNSSGQSSKEISKSLEKAVELNKECNICLTTASKCKYIGICGICNLFCCNKCLYAQRKVENANLKESANAYCEVSNLKLKCKVKLYLGKEKICSCCMMKLYVHFNFLSVLNENKYKNVDHANDEINELKTEFKELCSEYRKISEKFDKAASIINENDK